MPRSLSALFEDADALISSKVAGAKVTAQAESTDDIFKMAEWVRSGQEQDSVKVAEAETLSHDEDVLTIREKLAHAKALLETYHNLPTLFKIASLEESAREKGYTDAQIEAYLEKNAAEFPLKSIL